MKLFKELLMHTSGNVQEALSWLTELDRQYNLTDENYSLADFIKDLIDKGFLKEGEANQPGMVPAAKLENELRKTALEDIFGQIKRTKRGNHSTRITGRGDEFTSELRPYEFGDRLDKLAVSESLRNAQINHG